MGLCGSCARRCDDSLPASTGVWMWAGLPVVLKAPASLLTRLRGRLRRQAAVRCPRRRRLAGGQGRCSRRRGRVAEEYRRGSECASPCGANARRRIVPVARAAGCSSHAKWLAFVMLTLGLGSGMRPRNLVFITLMALCHLQLGGQTLTNALPPARKLHGIASALAIRWSSKFRTNSAAPGSPAGRSRSGDSARGPAGGCTGNGNSR